MHGIPEIIYVDNGKDWVSQHTEAVCLDFGIQLLSHEGYHPQSKGKIERWFKTLEEMCIHPLDGSVGSNLAKRPHKITPKLSLEQVRVKIDRFIKEYHERKHGTTKQPPLRRWLEDLTVVREVTNLENIDHLLKSKTYIVRRDGIHFQNGQYRDPDHILAGYTGRKVTVFFNPLDTSRIRVWANDEVGTFRFLCTAYPQCISDIPADRSAIAEDNKRRRDLIRNRVREAQKEGKAVMGYLEGEEAQRDVEAQQTSLPDKSAIIDGPQSSEPAAGLLSSHRPKATPSQPAANPTHDNQPDMDALRRQLIRTRRQQP